MKSVMKHQFSQVPRANIARSSFDRSHGYKTTFDAGYLIPVFIDEALPGDTFNLRMSSFARFATPLKAPMDNAFVESFFFAVPYRLVWNNWEKFNGAQDDPGDSTDFTIPQMVSPVAGYSVGTLHDYMGIPTSVGTLSHSSLWHRAYNLIWNNWFRDQNLQDSLVVDRDDGPDTYTDYVLQRRGKRHDYFTSCLPFPQKGDDVLLPLGSSAPIEYTAGLATAGIIRNRLTDAGFDSTALEGGAAGVFTDSGGNQVYYDPNGTLFADLSAATSATINALRESVAIQHIYERDARGGTRYTEIIKAHFNVTSPDARLQRPEYLGGGSSPLNIHPVAQTSEGVTETPQGNLASFGTASFKGHGFTKSFTEHCLIIGMVSVRADLTYQQGLNRMFSRATRFDFFLPDTANLGEQEVLNKEIYAQGVANPTEDAAVFGYQERFAEYRYKPSLITGQFRSTATTSLDVWHYSQEFTDLPTLSPEFIVEDPPFDRVIAVPSEPHFLFDAYFNFKCARPMPVFSVPGLGKL